MSDTEGLISGHPGRAAFEATAAERSALDPSVITRYTLDATYAVAQARAIALRLQPYRAEIADLRASDVQYLDKLVVYADALEFVHATLTSRAARVRALPELAAAGYALRGLLLSYGDVLALKGSMPGEVLARLRQGAGYRDLIEDLNALIVLYGERPEALMPGGPVGPEELEQARRLARSLSDQLGNDRDLDLSQDQLAQERRKIGYLLVSARSALRRSLGYLRFFEEDADTLVPSLYFGGRGRRTKRAAPAANPRDRS